MPSPVYYIYICVCLYIYVCIYIHTRQPKNFSYWLSGHYEGEPVRNINIPLGESGNLGVADHGEKNLVMHVFKWGNCHCLHLTLLSHTFTSPHQTDTGGRGRAKTEYMFIETATKKDLYIA